MLRALLLLFLCLTCFGLGTFIGKNFEDLIQQTITQSKTRTDSDNQELEVVGEAKKLTSPKKHSKQNNKKSKQESETINQVANAQNDDDEKESTLNEMTDQGLKLPKNKATKKDIGYWIIQIASLTEVNDLKRAITTAENLGYETVYFKTKVNGVIYYRLGIGPFIEQTQAQKKLDEVVIDGNYTDCYVNKITAFKD